MRYVLGICLLLSSHLSYSESPEYQFETLAENLTFPWSLAFLPDGSFLLTERGGQLRRISQDGDVSEPLAGAPATFAAGQGGYFDILLDNDFANNNTVYISLAHGTAEANAPQIVRATLRQDTLVEVTSIFIGEPSRATPMHYGGRMVQLPDSTLMMTTGDGFEYREAAQDAFSHLGKTIRINADGSVPADNPFADGKTGDPKVWTLGHRNPQGLVYDAVDDVVYQHEHGPQGGDEVNILRAGENYGWPMVTYGINYTGAYVSPFKQLPGIADPELVWTPSIAPSGFAIYRGDKFPQWQGDLFAGALVDREVRRVDMENGKVAGQQSLFGELGARIRDVRVGPDGYLYLLTDSDAGQLIRVVPVNEPSANDD